MKLQRNLYNWLRPLALSAEPCFAHISYYKFICNNIMKDTLLMGSKHKLHSRD